MAGLRRHGAAVPRSRADDGAHARSDLRGRDRQARCGDTAAHRDPAQRRSLAAGTGDRVVDEVNAEWRNTAAGAALISEQAELRHVGKGLEDSVKAAVSGWSDEVNALVRDIGQGRKSKARILSFGVSGVCAVIEYAAF